MNSDSSAQLSGDFRVNLRKFLGVDQQKTRLKPDGMLAETWKQQYNDVPHTTWQYWWGSTERNGRRSPNPGVSSVNKTQKDLRNLNKSTKYRLLDRVIFHFFLYMLLLLKPLFEIELRGFVFKNCINKKKRWTGLNILVSLKCTLLLFLTT